jgi:RHS repeat-associated protein
LFLSLAGGGPHVYRLRNFKTGPATLVDYAAVDVDGIAFAADGTLYAAGGGSVYRIAGTNTANPGAVTVISSTGYPYDGIAVASSITGHAAFLYVNRNDGVITKIDLTKSPTVTSDIITGGSRGDFAAVGLDGCLYATQSSTIIKVTDSAGACNPPLGGSTPPNGPPPPAQTGGGSPSGPPAPSPTCQHVGHPVNCLTGELWDRALDLSVKGRGLGLWLARTYSTALSAQDGPLGFGWTHSYNMSLTVNGDGSVTVQEEGGSVLTFQPTGPNSYQAPPWVFATLTRNPDGTFTLVRKNQARYTFSASGQLITEQDRNGYATSLTYANGQVASATDSSGRRLQFVYSGSHLVQVTDPFTRSVSFQFDSAGNLVAATDVAGKVTSFSYDSNHLLLTTTDPMGGVVTSNYDAAGRVVSQTDAMSRTTAFNYGTLTTTVTRPNGDAVQETWQDGTLASVTQGFGTAQAATWSLTHDPSTIALTSVTDPNGHTTKLTDDSSGNVLSQTDPLSRTWNYAYDSTNDLTSATDPMGVSIQLTYDSNGNLTQITRPVDSTTKAITTVTYDTTNPGDVIAVKDPDGNTFRFTHDQYGNVSRAADALGNAGTFTYDVVGRLLNGVTPNGGTTSYSYTPFDEVASLTDPLGHTTSYQYDGNRNVVGVTDPNGHTTKFAFDRDNEPLSTTRADGTQVQDNYDANGRLSTEVDGLGHITSFAYDPLQRLVSVTDALNRVTTINYDAAGNRTAVVDAKGQTTSFALDAANQPVGISYSDGKTPAVSYTYDSDGRRTGMVDGTGSSSYAYDSSGRLIQSTDGSGASVKYGYDLRGDMTSLAYPDGSKVTRTFDSDGRMSSVADWFGHTTRFAYDRNGNLTTQTYPNGVTSTLRYDAADRLTQISYSGPQGQISFTQGRDNYGQLTSETVVGAPPNGPVSYGYDQVNRVTSANYGIAQFGYQYDAANRLTQFTATTSQGSASSALSYDNADQLVSVTTTSGSRILQKLQFAYDANGNRIQKADQSGAATSYTYDQANRLTAIGSSAQYVYNGDGLRMRKTVGGAAEAFTWNLADGIPHLVQDGSTRYVSGQNGLPLEQVQADGTVRYYLEDGLGSTRALTNASGKVDSVYLYDPYGNVVIFSGNKTPNPFQFAGQYTDAESGFQYLRARYYDPSTASFLTRDPAYLLSGSAYGYANDSPLNFSDPTGYGLSLSGLGQWFWDHSEEISFVFGLLSLIFAATVFFAGLFDVISSAAGVIEGIKAAIAGKPWYEVAWNFAGPLATGLRLIGFAVKNIFRFAAAIEKGQSFENAVKGAIIAGVKEWNLSLLFEKMRTLFASVERISDKVGNILTWVSTVLYVAQHPPTIQPVYAPGPSPAPAPHC